MKKISAVLLAAALCLSLAACAAGKPGGTEGPQSAPPEAAVESAPVSQPLPVEEPKPESAWTAGGGITVSLLQSTYPEGTEKLTLVLDNAGEQELGYGAMFSCEKYVDGAWQNVEWEDGLGFRDLLYTVPAHSAGTMALNMSFLTTPLDQGLYRVTGSNLWIGEDEKAPAWQVSFRVTSEAQPEPDYALYISSQPIPTVEGCLVTDRLPVYFINTTGLDGNVLDIPRLEKLEESGEWTEVPYREGVGFCGTPSGLPARGREWSEDISMLWGALEDGQYRLSYAVGPTDDTEQTASGEFTLYTPEDNQGLPLAE